MSPQLQPGWIAPARTALLLIDMQRDFAASDGAMAGQGVDVTAAQAAVRQAAHLTDAARAVGVRPVFTRLLTVPGQETQADRERQRRLGQENGSLLCVAGTLGADFMGPLPRDGDPIITKPRFSAFAGTGLADTLRGQGIDTLVLAGLTTECCVQSSAWDAFERGFHVFLASDACAAYEENLHANALRSLELSGAILVKTADLRTIWK